MNDGSYVEVHTEDSIEEHDEAIAIISENDSNCFGKSPSSVIESACEEIPDYGESIFSTPNSAGYQMLADSAGRGETHQEEIHAMKMLVSHSLWIVGPETVRDTEMKVALQCQARSLPDESKVFSWVNNSEEQKELEHILEDICKNAEVATSEDSLKSKIQGYLGYGVNPKCAPENVRKWSEKAAAKIKSIG